MTLDVKLTVGNRTPLGQIRQHGSRSPCNGSPLPPSSLRCQHGGRRHAQDFWPKALGVSSEQWCREAPFGSAVCSSGFDYGKRYNSNETISKRYDSTQCGMIWIPFPINAAVFVVNRLTLKLSCGTLDAQKPGQVWLSTMLDTLPSIICSQCLEWWGTAAKKIQFFLTSFLASQYPVAPASSPKATLLSWSAGSLGLSCETLGAQKPGKVYFTTKKRTHA